MCEGGSTSFRGIFVIFLLLLLTTTTYTIIKWLCFVWLAFELLEKYAPLSDG